MDLLVLNLSLRARLRFFCIIYIYIYTFVLFFFGWYLLKPCLIIMFLFWKIGASKATFCDFSRFVQLWESFTAPRFFHYSEANSWKKTLLMDVFFCISVSSLDENSLRWSLVSGTLSTYCNIFVTLSDELWLQEPGLHGRFSRTTPALLDKRLTNPCWVRFADLEQCIFVQKHMVVLGTMLR